MATHVISHDRPRRKRGVALAYLGRRLAALGVAVAALAAANWLAGRHTPSLHNLPQPRVQHSPQAAPAPQSLTAEPAPILEAQTPPPRPRRARPIPLDAANPAPADDYEVLSAAELAAISQADAAQALP